MMKTIALAVVLFCMIGTYASAQPGESYGYLASMPQQFQPASSSEHVTTDCLIQVLDRVELSARRDGVLDAVQVRVGDPVSKGDLVWEQSKYEANANLAVAKARQQRARARAENFYAITTAEVELQRSTQELNLLDEVQSVPFLESFRARNTMEKNSSELKMARAAHGEDRRAAEVADAELVVAEIDVQDRSVVSPLNGVVVKQLKYQGEWCNRGDPILKIIRMDRLELQGIVNVNQIAPNSIVGLPVEATFYLAGMEPILMNELVIQKANPEVDLDGNYIVWTTIGNRLVASSDGSVQWLLRPGISGHMTIEIPRNKDEDVANNPAVLLSE